MVVEAGLPFGLFETICHKKAIEQFFLWKSLFWRNQRIFGLLLTWKINWNEWLYKNKFATLKLFCFYLAKQKIWNIGFLYPYYIEAFVKHNFRLSNKHHRFEQHICRFYGNRFGYYYRCCIASNLKKSLKIILL